MEHETQADATPAPAPAPAEEVANVPVEKSVEKDTKEEPKPSSDTPPPETEPEKKSGAEEETTMPQSVSFKEESNRVADLPESEKKALEELKQLIQRALEKHEFTSPPPTKEEPKPDTKERVVAEKPVTEEPVTEPTPPAVPEETHKPESEIAAAAVEETTPPPPAPADAPAEKEAVVEEAVQETVVVVAAVVDDGAKTVEAIEETVVAVATTTPPPAESDPPAKETEVEEVAPADPAPTPEEVFIWGIPLLGSDERSDVLLLKFLRARDFKAKDAFLMIKNTVRWRKEFGIDGLLEEDLGNDLEKVVFMHGFDKEGHPVCYNIYGEFQNKELYQKTFSDEEKRQKFLRWRIQFLEKGIQQLDFSPTGICTLVQVTDLKNSPGPGKRELRQATNQALSILQDNYPEFVAKQIFINVPWWYLAFNRMISPFFTQRTKSKFVFAGPSKSTETLFKYIAPEQVPVQYGGLSVESDPDFSTADAVNEVTIKPAAKHTVELPASEVCVLVWELRVLGWDVNYSAEFVPSVEDGYTVIVQKRRKMISTDEPVVKNSFKIGEPGKVVLTIENTSSKKKKLLFRSKTKSSFESI